MPAYPGATGTSTRLTQNSNTSVRPRLSSATFGQVTSLPFSYLSWRDLTESDGYFKLEADLIIFILTARSQTSVMRPLLFYQLNYSYNRHLKDLSDPLTSRGTRVQTLSFQKVFVTRT